MAGAATVLEDSSLLSRLDRALLPLERVMALLSGLAAFSLMFLAVYSVGGREFFESPLLGYVDLIESLMPLIAILGVSYVQRNGGADPATGSQLVDTSGMGIEEKLLNAYAWFHGQVSAP